MKINNSKTTFYVKRQMKKKKRQDQKAKNRKKSRMSIGSIHGRGETEEREQYEAETPKGRREGRNPMMKVENEGRRGEGGGKRRKRRSHKG